MHVDKTDACAARAVKAHQIVITFVRLAFPTNTLDIQCRSRPEKTT